MTVEEVNKLYQAGIPPEETQRALPPQEKLPRPPEVGPGLWDRFVNGPAYLVEIRNPRYFRPPAGLAQRELTEKAILHEGVFGTFWWRQALRTIVDTGWKLIVYGTLGSALLWGCSRFITGY